MSHPPEPNKFHAQPEIIPSSQDLISLINVLSHNHQVSVSMVTLALVWLCRDPKNEVPFVKLHFTNGINSNIFFSLAC